MDRVKPLSIKAIAGKNRTGLHNTFPHVFEDCIGKLYAYRIGTVKFIPSDFKELDAELERTNIKNLPTLVFSMRNPKISTLLINGTIELTANNTSKIAQAYNRCGCVAIVSFEFGRDCNMNVGLHVDDWNHLQEWLDYWLPKKEV